VVALQGAVAEAPLAPEAVLGVTVTRNRRREQALRVRLQERDGATVALPNGAQGSHVITSLVGADALALIPAGDGIVQAGTPVRLVTLPR
jgi:molybdopterin molybdotransferase